jgi:hypothetical protein
MTSFCTTKETQKRHMKFVVVNGRTPRPQSFCALCCKSIGESYVRELTTRLSYCDDNCYADNCKVAAALANGFGVEAVFGEKLSIACS